MNPEPNLEQLVSAGRLPLAILQAPPVELPFPLAPEILRERFRGCLLGVAIGDALGRAGEGHPFESTVAYFGGPLRRYLLWRGWTAGPTGTITDNTQMTMCIAESIVTVGSVDPADIGRRFAKWLDYGRGMGRTCREACERLRDGIPWYDSGLASSGNGAAMRTAPIGLLHARQLQRLREEAARVCMITHTEPTAVASTVALSAGVAYCLTRQADRFEAAPFIDFVGACTAGLEPHDIPVRRPEGSPTTLAKRLAALPELLAWPDDRAVYNYLYNGAFVLESLPTALYAFLRDPTDFEAVLFAAVDAGYPR